MQSQGWISATLLLTMFAGIFSAALLAFEVGLRFGKWRREQPHPESEAAARVIVTGILSMLAFVVGFTFRLGTDHFDARNQALHNEVISIGTAYHRADLLAEPERTKLRNGLREYVDLRLQGTGLESQRRHRATEAFAGKDVGTSHSGRKDRKR